MVGIEDNETFMAVCFAVVLGTILLALIYQHTTLFLFLHNLLLAKDESIFIRDWRRRGLKFALENHPIVAITFFTLATILIYFLIYHYIIK